MLIVKLLIVVHLFLCMILLVREVYFKCSRNYATSVFYSMYFFVFCLVPFVIHFFFDGPVTINPKNDYVISDIWSILIVNLLGILLVVFGIFFSTSKSNLKPEKITIKIVNVKYHIPAIVSINSSVLVVVGLVIFIYSSGMSFVELLNASRFEWISSAGYFPVGIVLSTYLIASTAIVIYSIDSKSTKSIIFWLSIFAAITYGVVTKDRKWIFYMMSGYLALMYERNGRQIILKKSHILFGFLVFILILLSQFLRDYLPRYFLGEDISFVDSVVETFKTLFVTSDLSYFYRASVEAAYQNINNGIKFDFAVIRRIIFFPIPEKFSFGLKPEDISAMFSDVVDGGSGNRRGSMPPGMFGLFILSFGWFFSFLFIPLFSYFIHYLDVVFRNSEGVGRIAVLSFFLCSVLYALRGDEGTSFYFVVGNFLVLKLAYLIVRQTK